MGEAKRRQAQGQRLADQLDRRLRAGEFGPAGAASRYLVVLDKSPGGRDALAALRATAGLVGLATVLESEPFRLWEASALFPFIVLVGGSGTPEQRSLLAAGTGRLMDEVLPRAWRQVAGGGPVGIVCALDEAVQGPVQAALQGLRG